MKQTSLYLFLAAMFSGSLVSADEGDVQRPVSIPSSAQAVQNTASVLPGNVFEADGIPVSGSRSRRALKLMDGINLFADVQTGLGYDSNPAAAAKGAESASAFLRVSPTLMAEARYRANRYTLAYKGDYAYYPDFEANTLANNDLVFLAQNVFDARSSVAWGASYLDRYDPVGSTDRSIGAKEADHHRDWLVNATFRYGADEAQGRIEVDTGVGSKRYLNNRAKTEAADVSNTELAGRFYYRLAPRTKLVTELRRTAFDYVSDLAKLDNTDWRYLLGVSWNATSALTGSAKLGKQRKVFEDQSVQKNYSGGTWEASLRWSPLTYSSFDVLTGRSATDPSGSAGVPVAKNLSVAWNHDWNSYVHSKLSAGRIRTVHRGTPRVDVEDAYSVGLMYDARRWLGIGLEYKFSQRESTANAFDNIRRLILLKLDASF